MIFTSRTTEAQELEGWYRIAEVSCRITPSHMSYELMWVGPCEIGEYWQDGKLHNDAFKNSMMLFDVKLESGQYVFNEYDLDGETHIGKFIFNDDNFDEGIYILNNGSEFGVSRL